MYQIFAVGYEFSIFEAYDFRVFRDGVFEGL